MKRKIKTAAVSAALICAVILCIKYPSDVGEAAKAAFLRCTDVMIPSMFIFMCLSCAASSSRITEKLLTPLSPLFKRIFRLDAAGSSIFILSLFSGYPTGIKLIFDALDEKKISSSYAQRLSCFCFSSGPAFISGIASMLFPETRAGLLLFLSVTLGNITAAVISGIRKTLPEGSDSKIAPVINARLIVSSVSAASSAMLKMCTMIIFFSGVLKMLKLCGIYDLIASLLSKALGTDTLSAAAYTDSFFEISCLADMGVCGAARLPAVSALLSFGGVCVLLQLISISDGRLNVKKFLVYRAVSAAASYLFCRILMGIFDFGLYSDAFSYKAASENAFSPIPSVFLMIMAFILLKEIKRSSDKF